MKKVNGMVRMLRFGLVMATLTLAALVQAASLQDLQGNPHKLDEYVGNGQWRVVMFWASDCHVCNMEVEQYIQFHEEHKDNNARLLGISIDGQARLEQAKDFMARHHVTFPTLIGEPDEVARMYNQLTGERWVGTPTIFVYTPEGELVAKQAGAVPTNLIEDFIKDYQARAGDGQGAAASAQGPPGNT